jgi:hypothetical protein
MYKKSRKNTISPIYFHLARGENDDILLLPSFPMKGRGVMLMNNKGEG